ncbi:MAG: Eco57I restriction-modification methylase domain-containing protein, partial [Anaerolineales bacterium]|nr:Eco57I restriction-modification methylase domain-containing protein [Anaerolineales bacterium]
AKVVAENGLTDHDTGWFKACKTIFDELNNFYNGSIFQERRELENVTVSNKVVRSVITDLQPENSPYNFAVLPVEILGTIYERFLGRVVRTTEKQVKIEDKPEVRKAGGVYYTPQYIVDYIVENTLGKLLDPTPNPSPNEEHIRRGGLTPADVAKIKILDPACGSGSFLLGAYSKLIDWHKDYFERAGKEKRDRESFYKDESGQIRLTAKLKRDILKNNLFGVDIDPQAVEVTRFSLSLKALEDLREGELTEERSLFHQTVLPDLSENIKNGNSLIGNDYFAGKMFSDTAEMKRVNAFDWKSEFEEIMENGGFDGIIGNPPYIRIQTMKEWAPLEVEIYKEIYQSAKAGNYDIYVVFVEKALSLLNERGRMGYILPHKFFNSQYGAGLRGLVANGKHLGKVIHFGDQQVFDGATTYTCLLFLNKTGNDDFEMVRVQDLNAWREQATQTSEFFKNSEVSGRIAAANVTDSEWNFTVGKGAGLFEKLSQMPVKLGDVADLFVGLQTDADDVYILEERRKENDKVLCFSKYTEKEHWFEENHLKDFLKGSLNIRRYYFSDVTKRLIFPYRTVDSKSVLIDGKEYKQYFPLTWAYLEECQERLVSRNKGKMGKDWHSYVYK